MKLQDQTGKKVELGFIYALKNPTTNEIFYIGATESAPKDRLQGHYCHFKEYLCGKRNKTRKFEYFESIFPEIAQIDILHIVTNDYLFKIEQATIKEYSEKYDLVNQTIGGEGGDTFTMQEYVDKLSISELIGQKNRGKKKPEGFGENLSKQRMGANNPMAGASNMGMVIIFEDDEPICVCKAPFEITAFFDDTFGIENHKKHAGRSGNISKKMRQTDDSKKIYNSGGYLFKSYSICSKEVQDIVRRKFESSFIEE